MTEADLYWEWTAEDQYGQPIRQRRPVEVYRYCVEGDPKFCSDAVAGHDDCHWAVKA